MNLGKLKLLLSLIIVAVLVLNCGTSNSGQNNESGSPQISQSNEDLAITDQRAKELVKYRKAIEPFFDKMEIQDGDWLTSFKENGQTFEEYISQNPTLPTNERRKIYIQPIGEFTPTQRKVISLTADFMRRFYNLPVVLSAEKNLGTIRADFTRKNPSEGHIQLKTGFFLDDKLPKMLPDDGAALICFTNYDLFPNDSYNYVFGQASLSQRVGVWSLWRFGNPDKSETDFEMFLGRTLKVGMHETGHMFSMQHCTKYECLMSGSNHLKEKDRRPIDVCPECVLKIAWAMNYDLKERYENLAEYCEFQAWNHQAATFRKKAAAIKKVTE